MDKIEELKQAAAAAKSAPVYEKGERIGEVVDLLIDILWDFQQEIDALKGGKA